MDEDWKFNGTCNHKFKAMGILEDKSRDSKKGESLVYYISSSNKVNVKSIQKGLKYQCRHT